MRRFGIIGVYLFALAAWAQVLAPAATARMQPASGAFGSLCATPSTQPRDRQSNHRHSPAHGCCLLCQASLVGPPLDSRPAVAALDDPIASWLGWRPAAGATPRPPRPTFRHGPRDPPALV